MPMRNPLVAMLHESSRFWLAATVFELVQVEQTAVIKTRNKRPNCVFLIIVTNE
jgi:hypothetical protein